MPCYNQKKRDKLGNPADDTDDTLKSDKNDNNTTGQAEASNTSTLTLDEVSKKHSLIRGVFIQSYFTGAKNFTNYVFCHPQFSGVIQNIENRCVIRAKF